MREGPGRYPSLPASPCSASALPLSLSAPGGGLARTYSRGCAQSLLLFDALIRNGWVLTLVAAIGLWEAVAPRYPRVSRRSLRWPTSFTLGPLNALLASLPLAPLVFVIALTGRSAPLAVDASFGSWLTIVLSVLLLDLVFYGQHRLLHAVPITACITRTSTSTTRRRSVSIRSRRW